MDISRLAEIESCANELSHAAKTLAEYCQTAQTQVSDSDSSTGLPSVAPDRPSQAHRARKSILASVARLQNLIAEPGRFLEQLASQNQLLACLHWLSEFQVLACIPLQGNVPARDVAELTGVPEILLVRVVRMTSTAGFLCEPRPRHVAHTPLSAGFVTKPSLGDAAVFLGGTVGRAALHMAAATQRYGETERPEQSSFVLSDKAQQSFHQACEQRPKLQRQWAAYRRWLLDVEDRLAELLSRFDWERQRSACIIEAGPLPSCIVRRIAERNSHLHITVQISEPSLFDTAHHAATGGTGTASVRDLFGATISSPPSPASVSPPVPSLSPSPPSLHSSHVSVQRRATGQPQTVRNAGVYVLNLGSPSTTPAESLSSLIARVTAELLAHLPVLRHNRGATLVVAMRLLPDPESADAAVEADARTRDLVLLQLANERDLEVSELVDLIQAVGDRTGRLTVVSRATGRDNSVTALAVRFQATA
ncbi:O-methyltransferase family protein [Parathielavia appendiculata]|uniref:O-methyltransferase family protein n=1 Tax=Parathielavia appendiculata TaxID=2587402 RepID=A0AAN6TRW5_9PEZI|nr:O-methyltransferase family protein [Parathielavia appendiculata]